MTDTCFHCHELVPPGLALSVRVADCDEPVCCVGCQAVAQLILEGGHGDYYRFREGPSRRLDPRELACLEHWKAFDDLPVTDTDGIATIQLLIDGVHCGACAWLIERRLHAIDGVHRIDVDIQSGTGVLRWRPKQVALSEILIALVRLGYGPHPLDDAAVQRTHRAERDGLLRRLAVAGLGMMQVMMFAVATYAGAMDGIDPAIERLLLGVSMLVATPVVFYAGAPFLIGAWRALSARHLSMDVPVALALMLAFGASCVHFFAGRGTTYFESVSMFVFFLLCARFVATLVRHRSLDAQLALTPMLPDVALKLEGAEDSADYRAVPRRTLTPGDRIRVRGGDAVAADGIVLSGQARVDESLLTGESEPVFKTVGDVALAGSVNLDGAITIKVTAADNNTRVARIAGTLGSARAARPAGSQLAERIAGRFVLALLIIASVVGITWWVIEPTRALGIVLAVLVVTCPCALSLAIPTAQSAASTRLAREGLLVHRPDVLDTLTRISTVLFDKTGTLTRGAHTVVEVRCNAEHSAPLTQDALLEYVARLERFSAHPLARAFDDVPVCGEAQNVREIPGRGIQGTVAGRRLRVGNARFVGAVADAAMARDAAFLVSDDRGLLGALVLSDQWRADAATAVERFGQAGITTRIVSGDRLEHVTRAVAELGLDCGDAECLPEDKLAALRGLQRTGEVVLAVGDGVNDAALLAGADVSVAISSGAELAQSGADIVLTGNALAPVADLPEHARRLRTTVRQNLGWAVGYNVLAVPLAAAGWIGPGLAALGMSLSSLLVVLNSSRLARRRRNAGGPASDARAATRAANPAIPKTPASEQHAA